MTIFITSDNCGRTVLQACDKFFIKENEQLVTILWQSPQQSMDKLATYVRVIL